MGAGKEEAMGYAVRACFGEGARLADIDPAEHGGLSRDSALARAEELGERVADLADLLFAARMHALLVVIQGRDTAGKDGVIRRLLSYVNAQSCRVVPFKAPVGPEIEHDFLWRVHSQTPGRGDIALFNRSHYEDVLVVRVRNLAPPPVWQGRYDHINAFENLLLDSGTIIVKLMLHISKKEQEERLLEREGEVEKAWKLNLGDWQEREYWDAYTEAYEEVFRRCSPDRAPWYVVPSDHKWFRDVAALECIAGALEPYRKDWMAYLKDLGAARRRDLEAFRAEHEKR
jgi:PPK2 family polyphosphate:nucleotide phosphotransferase